MKKLLLITALYANAAGLHQEQSLVSQLGPRSDVRSIEAIARYGCDAVPLLVQQLEVVQTEELDLLDDRRDPRAMRVIWSIAALRYITGRDFYAVRSWRIDPASVRHQRLASGAPPGRTKFFGIWMSRQIAYFAPPAQQRNIIRRWQRYSSSGQCIRRSENRDFMFWLYGVRG